jgi:hypothetical protein
MPRERQGRAAPLFVSFDRGLDGRQHFWALPRSHFIAQLKDTVWSVLQVSPELYAGYSLRRGGVTELLSRNMVSLAAIKRHVGWAATSNAVFDYFDHSAPEQLLFPTAHMGLDLEM